MLIATALLIAAATSTEPAIADSAAQTKETVAFLGGCVAAWNFAAEIQQQAGKNATAEYMHRYANGAQMAAIWTLSTQWRIEKQ